MKLNWGTSIAIFYSLFVLVMIFMVVKSSQNSVQLVQENYYDKDLNYEEFRQSRLNSEKLAVRTLIEYQKTNQKLILSFPAERKGIEGDVQLYRPSNKFKDARFPIQVNEANVMELSVSNFTPGNWKILINWTSAGVNYQREETLVL